MAEEKRSFWSRIFRSFYRSSYGSGREEKILQYVIHRIGDGASLRDVLQEEYVRRNASPKEIEDILENPRLVEAARKKLGEDFSSGDLDPR
jgi:hypothetical protein